VYIIYGRQFLIVSAVSAFALDTIVNIALSFLSDVGTSNQGSLLVIQSALMILPVVTLYFAGIIRIRYCLSCSGIFSALAWLAVFFMTDIGSQLSQILRDSSGLSAEMLYSMIPDGYDKVAFQKQVNGDMLNAIMTKIFSCTFVSFFVVLYALSFVVASGIASLVKKQRSIAFDSRQFFVEYWIFIPLVAGMTGIIAGKLVGSAALDPLFWNVFALSAVFFVLQGYGILRFLLSLFRQKAARFFYFLVSVALFVFAFELWPVFIVVLFIAGVLELFVPVRMRFNNKDITDPTPGNGQ
jgi:hypothetical protein